jgi:hypothetical protein
MNTTEYVCNSIMIKEILNHCDNGTLFDLLYTTVNFHNYTRKYFIEMIIDNPTKIEWLFCDAMYYGCLTFIKLLNKYGNINKFYPKRVDLYMVIKRGHKHIIDWYIHNNFKIYHDPFKGNDEIHYAAKNGYLELLKIYTKSVYFSQWDCIGALYGQHYEIFKWMILQRLTASNGISDRYYIHGASIFEALRQDEKLDPAMKLDLIAFCKANHFIDKN